MTVTLVDANVLLDVATNARAWSKWASEALEQAAYGSELRASSSLHRVEES
jgi:hypothetical protein